MRRDFVSLLTIVLLSSSSLLASMAAKQNKNSLKACKSDIVYEQSPLAYDDITYIVPLGNMNPSAHTFPTRHQYFHLPRQVDKDFSTPSVRSLLSSPGDIRITQIDSVENLTAGYTIYSIFFFACKKVEVYFLHVTSLSDSLARKYEANKTSCREYETGGETYEACNSFFVLDVETRGELGYAGGDMFNNALDMGLLISATSLIALPTKKDGKKTSTLILLVR